MAVLGSLKRKRAGRRKPLKGRSWNAPDFTWMRTPDLPECGNNMVYTPPTKSFIDSLHNERKEVKVAAQINMSSTAPLFSKGGYQFVSKNDDPKAIGRKV